MNKRANKELTRGEVLERLREVWKMLRLDRGELQGAKDFMRVSAIGFETFPSEEYDDFGDE